MEYIPRGSFAHGDSPGKNTRLVCHALLQGIKPTSPTLQAVSLPSEPSCYKIFHPTANLIEN